MSKSRLAPGSVSSSPVSFSLLLPSSPSSGEFFIPSYLIRDRVFAEGVTLPQIHWFGDPKPSHGQNLLCPRLVLLLHLARLDRIHVLPRVLQELVD